MVTGPLFCETARKCVPTATLLDCCAAGELERVDAPLLTVSVDVETAAPVSLHLLAGSQMMTWLSSPEVMTLPAWVSSPQISPSLWEDMIALPSPPSAGLCQMVPLRRPTRKFPSLKSTARTGFSRFQACFTAFPAISISQTWPSCHR